MIRFKLYVNDLPERLTFSYDKEPFIESILALERIDGRNTDAPDNPFINKYRWQGKNFSLNIYACHHLILDEEYEKFCLKRLKQDII